MENNPYKPELTGLALTRALAETLDWRNLEERDSWYEDIESDGWAVNLYGTSPDGKADQYFGNCAHDVVDALRVCRQFCANYRFVMELEWYMDNDPFYRAQAAFRDLYSGDVILGYVTNSFNAPDDTNPEAGAISRLMLRILEQPEYAQYRERAEYYSGTA